MPSIGHVAVGLAVARLERKPEALGGHLATRPRRAVGASRPGRRRLCGRHPLRRAVATDPRGADRRRHAFRPGARGR